MLFIFGESKKYIIVYLKLVIKTFFKKIELKGKSSML